MTKLSLLAAGGATCVRCCGHLIRDPVWDLPRRIQEFSCLNCGERFWLDFGAEGEADQASN
ncbi:MAG TPA: hypothetical protein VNO81_09665 [Candidatus Nitrosotenuis sp.]|jgi:hypothetical protein|nr:hypothetical protein [Candidatus Nitrosotenuis sp.]